MTAAEQRLKPYAPALTAFDFFMSGQLIGLAWNAGLWIGLLLCAAAIFFFLSGVRGLKIVGAK